ncbi:hypothetical protein SEA_PEPE25_24 [Microbacterium phage Pepe25]|nr:hypothetical protein SEA_PEPE25_24 [Microbacterium phage Pepe25]
MAGPDIPIEAPERTDRVGGLTKVATFRPNSRLGVAESVVFQSDGCTFPQTEESRCYALAEVPDKTYDGIEINDAIGAPVTLYAGVSCWAGPDADELERAERALDAGRDRVLEEILGEWGLQGTALDAGGDVVGAIAEVEQDLDDNYVGRGVILMSRADAVRADAAGAIHLTTDGVPVTVNGTPVIASGRIPSGNVIGLGAIVVEYTDIASRETINPTENKHYALAEAIYVLAVDCEYRVKSSTSVGIE